MNMGMKKNKKGRKTIFYQQTNYSKQMISFLCECSNCFQKHKSIAFCELTLESYMIVLLGEVNMEWRLT